MENQEQEREEIIELFGVHFEKHHNMSPLASRILASLILYSREKDLTFEDLVNITGASKSSVSTNLHLLLETKKIEYYTICGDRKKYFKPSSLAERIKNHLEIVKSEQILINRIKNYESQFQFQPSNAKESKVKDLYSEYVNEFERLINEFINKIEEIETK